MSRREFPYSVKVAAYNRQGGVCAFCGVKLMPPWPTSPPPKGGYFGEAHHLRPDLHDGTPCEDNCVYLCYGDHKLMGHGMAPYGIAKQDGSPRTWVQLSKRDFPFWNKK